MTDSATPARPISSGPTTARDAGHEPSTKTSTRFHAELEESGSTDQEIDAIRRHGTPVLQQRIATEAVQAALAGTEGVGETVGYRGVLTLASWEPLSPASTWCWSPRSTPRRPSRRSTR